MAPHPLVINIARLGRRPGTVMAISDTVPSPARIGLDLVAIDAGSELELDLQLQSVSEGVLVTGTVSAPTFGECARCLTPFTGDVQISLTELFAYPNSVTAATTDDDDISRIVDDAVNLEQPIRDAVGLELPLSPVCREDCPGLCPQCGVALAGEPDHQHEVIDPRWAKLAGLRRDQA